MENIKDLSPSEIKMIELKRKEEQLEIEREKIKKEKLREEQLVKMMNSISKKKRGIEIDNSNIQLFIKKCREEDIGEDFIWIVKRKENITIKVEGTYSYSELTKEDEASINVDKFLLNSKWSSGVYIDNEAKISCENITGRWQAYTMNGFIKKLKEKIEEEKYEQERKIKSNIAKEKLIKYFQENSPEGTKIIEEEKYIRGLHGRDLGYTKKIIKLEYPNSSWVKLSYYNDGSWSISEKYDHKLPKFDTKEEWLEYLSK